MIININDYNINYIDEGSGEAVLLLHGWGSDLKGFASLISLLKTKYRVLAIDYPGFGESDKLKTSFCVDDYCDIVVEFLKKLNIDRVILVGHSYGGRIILKLNNRNDLPFIIEKNVLIDAAGIIDKKDIVVKIKIVIYKLFKKIFISLPVSSEKKDELVMKLRKKLGSSDYGIASKVMQETLVKSVNEDLTYCLDNMKESLIIWGDRDTVTPVWMAKLMEERIKNSGLVVLKGGHFSYIDDPNTFSRVMISYFNL